MRLDAIAPGDLARVGGKAFNCARLKQAGFPVPDGIVIPSDATDAEIQRAGRRSVARHRAGGHAVRRAVVGHRRRQRGALVCRHSRDAAERRARISSSRRCWCAAAPARRTRRAPIGTRVSSATTSARIAVLVQRMVPAVTSGVAFTINPITGADELVINAARGLGEALVSGLIDPDEFRDQQARRDGAVGAPRLGRRRDAPAWRRCRPRSWRRSARCSYASNSTTARRRTSSGATTASSSGSSSRARSPPRSRIRNPKPQSGIRIRNPNRSDPNRVDAREPRRSACPISCRRRRSRVYDGHAQSRASACSSGRLLAPDAELGPMVKAFHGRMYFNLSQMRHVAALVGAPAGRHAAIARPLRSRFTRRTRSRSGAPLREFLRVPAGFHPHRAATTCAPSALMRRHEAAHARDARAHHRRRSANAVGRARSGTTIQWWLEIAPDAIQIVFVMSGVLFREDCAQEGVRRASGSRTSGWSTRSWPPASARSARSRRSISSRWPTSRGTSRAAMKYLLDERRRVRRLPHGACRHDVPRAVRSVPRAATAIAAATSPTGRCRGCTRTRRRRCSPSSSTCRAGRQDLKAVAERQEADAAGAWRAFEARLTTVAAVDAAAAGARDRCAG